MIAEKNQNITGKVESYHTVVIGGGQAGLAAGYFLSQNNEHFIILDNHSRTGAAWRCRWDSLRLFTPSQFDSLPGMPFPKAKNYFPSKDEVGDYLENYALQNNLPLCHNANVESLTRYEDGYQISASDVTFTARNVIIATGPFQLPYTPSFSSQLDPGIKQIHSKAYLNPTQMPVQSVLVVGAGNSGAEIALELSKTGKKVWLAGRDVGTVPANSPLGKLFDGRLIWWFMTHMLTVDTPMGRKMQAGVVQHGTPLGRTKRAEIKDAGIMITSRVKGVQSGKPKLEDGRSLQAEGIVWATGLRPDYHWIRIPIFDPRGYPIHSRGIVKDAPGLYFIGLPFQTGLSSALLGGVGKDARSIAAQVFRNGR